MSKSNFISRILAASDDRRDLFAARAEWRWIGLLENAGVACLCGRPLPGDACLIEHARSGRRAAQDPNRAFNEDFVDFAHANGILSDWEANFYADTWRKRVLTDDQERKRRQINFKALRAVRGRMASADAGSVRRASETP